MAVRYGENESEAPRWADHLAMNGRIVRSHFGIRFRPVAKWKKLSLSQMIRLSATLIHFSQLFQLIEFSIFCLKKKFLLQTNENFFKVNSFKFRKKNSGKFRQIGPKFFFLPKSVIWREKTTNEWRRGTKKKEKCGTAGGSAVAQRIFFLVENNFFSLKFHFPRSEKKWNFPNILNEWTFRWKKNSDFFFFKTKFRFVSEQDANWSWSVN